MSVPELIATVLQVLCNQWYCDQRRGAFERDERYLIAALATYGKECADRGWHFDAPAIQRELLGLLQSFKRSGVEPHWMPIYLQNAIRRHIGQRAEELHAAARSIPNCTARVVNGVKPVVLIEKSATELLALMYADVRKLKRQNQAVRRPKPAVARLQPEML